MEISKVTKYRCDICGKESEWIKGTWIAHTFLLSSSYGGHEHEFHLCSQACEERILRLTRSERNKIFKRMDSVKL